ncbi:DNA translocase FtsK [Flexibacterium corallicola]|uniref:DNA translocase FtsK n=1 Tax=Flexibacterium corallicola TaxID=3037259 RepID=UPI00286F1FB4|nr:DNA translocase FtsK 4TM domain-containing protein [Pseudovibrio sp. M1P-2-3]
MRRANTLNTSQVPTLSPEDTESPLKSFLRRNLIAATGLLVIFLCVLLAAALATWTVSDPSLSHATENTVRNALGTPGAIVADVLMQAVGLASLALLFPLLMWGWRIFWNKKPRVARRKLLSWGAGTFFFSGALAALPITTDWPLPTGLGGFLGDWIFAVPSTFSPPVSEGMKTLIGVLGLGIPSLLLLVHASGWIGQNPEDLELEPAEHFEDEDYDEENEDSYLSARLGAISHWKLMVVGAVQRLLFKRNSQEDKVEEEEEYDDYAPEPHVYSSNIAPEEEEIEEETERPSLIERLRDVPTKISERFLPQEDDGLADFYEKSEPQSEPQVFTTPTDQTDIPWNDMEQDHEKYEDDFEVDQPDDIQFDIPAIEPVPMRPVGIAPPVEPQKPVARVVPQAEAPKPREATVKSRPAPTPVPLVDYELPDIDLLQEPRDSSKLRLSQDALEQNARILEGVLEDFGIRGEIIEVRPGPVVTLYELSPAPGIKSSRVIGLADDIARSMSAISARVAVIPGKNAIGIELPNARRETVYLRELIASEDFDNSKAKLAMTLGKTINGEAVIADLARMPHLLVAGTTGSGKSVSVNTMILSLLYRLTPEQCKLIMIDPKMLELSIYDGIPHLLTPVVTDPNKAVVALKWTVREMEDRYKKMSKMGVRNIDGYNTRIAQALKKGEAFTRTVQTGFDRDTGEPIFEDEELPLEKMPYIVVVVDEMADLMMVAGKDIEGAIQRLAQMARAAGIHIIMATQRPSVDVITGTIKANFPTRISFQVTSKIDSRTILGEMGAEQLLGMGDMLYMAGGRKTQRVHGPFVDDDEVEAIVNHLKEQGVPQYLESVTEDDEASGGYDALSSGSGNASNDLFDQAVAIVARDKKASTSYIQRRLSIGYNRAASLIERMEQEGIIGPANHAGKREILVRPEDEEMM